MYRIPTSLEFLSQGDIFRRRCAFPYTASLADDYLVVREDQEEPQPHGGLADAWTNNNAETVLMPTMGVEHFIILSNSCDAESNTPKPPLEFVLVGAVMPLQNMPQGNQDNCRNHKLVRYHYLAPEQNTAFVESFVYFGLVSLIRQESLVQSKNSRILALAFPHREDLSHRFGEFISRVALD
jgi:hypothetical protein